MTEKRNLRLDLIALALLAVFIFMALALLTYSPADPVTELVAPFDRLYHPDVLVHPQNPTVLGFNSPWTDGGTSLWRSVSGGLNHPSIDGEAGHVSGG